MFDWIVNAPQKTDIFHCNWSKKIQIELFRPSNTIKHIYKPGVPTIHVISPGYISFLKNSICGKKRVTIILQNSHINTK